jgi:glycosyltransferase involved in cell wall biosynthesis
MLKNLAVSVLNRVFSYLPCYVISYEPLIIISYWHDFVINQNDFLASLSEQENVYILIQIGWHRETPERAQELVDVLAELKEKHSGLHFTFLCNSPHEEEIVKTKGLNAVFCHQNAFVDENLYPVIPGKKKLYDAIYIARVTPFKRQELAQKIKTLRFIGWTSPLETDYFNKIMTATPQAKWTCSVASNKIYREINAARVGLCLSAEEGAMFVSAEYMLCGIPAVTTKNMGGREALFPEEAFCYVDDNPESVAAGVAKFIEHSPAPLEIRQAYIKNMYKHREVFIKLVQDMINSSGKKINFKEQWKSIFIHKFGLRRHISIWTKIKHGIKRK